MTSTIYFRVQAAARRNILWSPIVLMLAEKHIWDQSERGTTPRQGAYPLSYLISYKLFADFKNISELCNEVVHSNDNST